MLCDFKMYMSGSEEERGRRQSERGRGAEKKNCGEPLQNVTGIKGDYYKTFYSLQNLIMKNKAVTPVLICKGLVSHKDFIWLG